MRAMAEPRLARIARKLAGWSITGTIIDKSTRVQKKVATEWHQLVGAQTIEEVTPNRWRMFTDTVSPHSMGMKFAIEYYGIDHVMYGTDYPCWDPAPCLKLLENVTLSEADKHKLFYSNARRILGLKDPASSKTDAKREPALV